MANVLAPEKQRLCLKMLCEGSSIRAVERTAEVHRDTVMRLMVQFGEGCRDLLDIKLRNLRLDHIEIDEQWTWVAKKNKRIGFFENPAEIGDQYLFCALDQETKLIASHVIGKRNEITTREFVTDLAARIVLPENVNAPMDRKPMISSDGWQSYPSAILDTFGSMVQYGQIIKAYSDLEMGRYAPPEIVSTERRRVQFVNDLLAICTSHVERFNCTTRQFVKRFCRLTLAFSKKLRNLKAAVAMHVANYNFCWRPRENGNSGKLRPTPAMMAGVERSLWSFDDLFQIVMG